MATSLRSCWQWLHLIQLPCNTLQQGQSPGFHPILLHLASLLLQPKLFILRCRLLGLEFGQLLVQLVFAALQQLLRVCQAA